MGCSVSVTSVGGLRDGDKNESGVKDGGGDSATENVGVWEGTDGGSVIASENVGVWSTDGGSVTSTENVGVWEGTGERIDSYVDNSTKRKSSNVLIRFVNDNSLGDAGYNEFWSIVSTSFRVGTKVVCPPNTTKPPRIFILNVAGVTVSSTETSSIPARPTYSYIVDASHVKFDRYSSNRLSTASRTYCALIDVILYRAGVSVMKNSGSRTLIGSLMLAACSADIRGNARPQSR